MTQASGRRDQPQVAVLDYGSQYTQLIARRLRELGVYSEITPFSRARELLGRDDVRGIVLSGGPSSVDDPGAPDLDVGLLAEGKPLLGICYGMQLICRRLGGALEASDRREYGPAQVERLADDALFDGTPAAQPVWMSHGDRVARLPEGFVVLARSDAIPFAAAGDPARRIYAVQFHPEVAHTEHGLALLRNFACGVCGLAGDWSAAHFVAETVAEIRERVGDGQVLCGVSGGVDSTVTASLIDHAVGDRLHAVFVDNGLLRLGEAGEVERDLNAFLHRPVHCVDARDRFLSALRGVEEPERKRKIIGGTFIEVFKAATRDLGEVSFLAQGTLYPDRIESVSINGPSHVIKSHHNVGGLPAELGFELIEPLRDLFKDEVRAVGRSLGIPDSLLMRHPFPGPGLGVRILGEVSPEKVRLLQRADHIFIQELRDAGQYERIWQAGAVLLPVRTVGVMGDQRTYEAVVALRAVTSLDGMTADWARIPDDVLARVGNRIINEVPGINRVVYDISSKPPSTIEWE
ncbi:MAG: GMP synthase (glutamine-hydrolyzing) [Gemmatimonas sp.]|nr:GMP synthase (glutamine-hydrolyzing) [Gemmatimonas sp.]